ncbi:MAG: hypothetical protein Q4P30_02495 [Eubacteriales bacterium]|nr:hypothetical protein [Eubacteriales bacterium]
MRDYKVYQMDRRERLRYRLTGTLIIGVVLWIFFRTVWVLPAAPVATIFYMRKKRRQLLARQTNELRRQFKEMLFALRDALKTGNAPERAFAYACEEMEKLYGKDAMITGELQVLLNREQLNIGIEHSMADFAERSGIREIEFFGRILQIAKRRGGNVIEMVGDCTETISHLMETEEEIQMILTGKVHEKRIMEKIPLFIVFYVSLFSPEMLNPLYESAGGRIIMAAAFVIYGAAVYWADRIVDIRV